jgi:hypothetical protein
LKAKGLPMAPEILEETSGPMEFIWGCKHKFFGGKRKIPDRPKTLGT